MRGDQVLCRSQLTNRVILLFQLGSDTTDNLLAYRVKNLAERVPMNHALTILREEAGRE